MDKPMNSIEKFGRTFDFYLTASTAKPNSPKGTVACSALSSWIGYDGEYYGIDHGWTRVEKKILAMETPAELEEYLKEFERES
jgi:hypothetical protein